MIYNAENFTAIFKTPFGQAIWKFLLEPETMVRLDTATSLGRPAIEGIEEALLLRFEKDAESLKTNERYRQMIGHMVRQIMEARNYVVDMQNVKITNGFPFARGTRFKRQEDFMFHVHEDSRDGRSVALTADKAGAALPKDKRWVYWKSFQGALRGRIAFGLQDEAAARADIERQGYYLYRMERILRPA